MYFEEYENVCIKLRNDNEKSLEIFRLELSEKGLSAQTIRSHLSNVDFYINDFLLYSEPVPMKNGCVYVDEFLGDFFIRKCMWSTPGTIKSTAASLKKFYKCMLEHGEVRQTDYRELCKIIKDNMDDWLDDCRQFNDPDQGSPFSFF